MNLAENVYLSNGFNSDLVMAHVKRILDVVKLDPALISSTLSAILGKYFTHIKSEGLYVYLIRSTLSQAEYKEAWLNLWIRILLGSGYVWHNI